MDHENLSGRQLAAARALIGKTQAEIAAAARISIPTLKRMEASGGSISGMTNNVAAVVSALEHAGVKFVDDGQTSAAGGPGVRLTTSSGNIDTDQSETLQYPEHLEPDAPTGAGG